MHMSILISDWLQNHNFNYKLWILFLFFPMNEPNYCYYSRRNYLMFIIIIQMYSCKIQLIWQKKKINKLQTKHWLLPRAIWILSNEWIKTANKQTNKKTLKSDIYFNFLSLIVCNLFRMVNAQHIFKHAYTKTVTIVAIPKKKKPETVWLNHLNEWMNEYKIQKRKRFTCLTVVTII